MLGNVDLDTTCLILMFDPRGFLTNGFVFFYLINKIFDEIKWTKNSG